MLLWENNAHTTKKILKEKNSQLELPLHAAQTVLKTLLKVIWNLPQLNSLWVISISINEILLFLVNYFSPELKISQHVAQFHANVNEMLC